MPVAAVLVIWLLVMLVVLAGSRFTLRVLLVWVVATAVILELFVLGTRDSRHPGLALLGAAVAILFLWAYGWVRVRQGHGPEGRRAVAPR